ncbi:MAG: TolC family protein [Cyclobacteriaceae bacterium]|nr:TolC family protein [Cyclobacteriaceae bacterium]
MKQFLFLILICVTGGVAAQESEDKILTFQEAVSIALRNNVTLAQQKNNLEAAQMQRTASLVNMAPTVNINAFAQQFNGNSFNQQQGRAVNGVRDAVNGSLNASLPLFNGFNLVNSVKQTSNQLEAQSYFVKRTTEDVINTVSSQYLQVLLDIELLRIAVENLEAQKVQLDQIKEQVNVGSRSPVDEYNQLGLTKASELRMLQAEINLTNDRAMLTQTLLIDPFAEFEVEKPTWSLEEVILVDPNPEAMYTLAKENRGDLLRAINTEEASRYGMMATRGLMAPALGAFFSYGSAYNYQHDIPDSILANNPSINRPFEDQFRTDNVYKSYGLQLTIPILNGFQARNRMVQQKITYRNNKLQRDNTEIIVKTDVLRASKNFQVGKTAYQVSQAQLDAAELAFQLESERYELGITNFVDFAQANRQLVQAQTDKAQAEYRLIFQKILLEYATGTLKIEGIQD